MPERLNQESSNPDERLNALATLLEQSGLPTREALEVARESLIESDRLAPGSTFGGLHAEHLPGLWQQAARAGRRRIVLEIEFDSPVREEAYHLRVRVLEADDWQD
jgi:hypothetical protein